MKSLKPIRMNPFQREPRALKKQVHSAVRRVVKSGYFILGPEVEAFEQEWSDFTGITHSVGVGNGLDALELGMRALGIGPGDEVVTTAMTAFATVLAIHRVGATPVIADIDEDTALLSLDSVKTVITKRTKAIIFVHLYGRAGDLAEWVTFCHDNDLYLIEDCAQAHGAKVNGQHVGSFGVFGAFSFYPTKNLGGLGDGGALVTEDAEIARQVHTLRNYGQQNRYEHVAWGSNSRLDEIQAAILREKLKWLPEMNKNRRQNYELLRSLSDGLPELTFLAPVAGPEQHVNHLLVVRVTNRDMVMEKLGFSQIDTLIHYPIPSHLQKPLASSASAGAQLLHADRHAATCMTLPSSPWVSKSEISRIATELLRAVLTT